MTDDIIKQAQKGDVQAFEAIYSEYSNFVWRVICKMVSQEAYRSDIIQDVFVTVFRKLKQFRFQAQFSTWLYRITFSVIMNHLNKHKRIEIQAYSLQINTKTHGSDEEIFEIERQDDQQLLIRLLGLLNPNQKACITLKYIEDLSYEEISQVLNINIGTVRSTLNRAKKILKELWIQERGEVYVTA